jgi:hypothetical protein
MQSSPHPFALNQWHQVAGGRFALLIDRQARRFAALNTRGVSLQRARSAGLNCGDDATCGGFCFAVCAKPAEAHTVVARAATSMILMVLSPDQRTEVMNHFGQANVW